MPVVAVVAPVVVAAHKPDAYLNTRDLPRRLLIIAPPGSYRLTPYINAAKKLGLIPQIASTGQRSVIPSSDEGIHLDLHQPEQALEIILSAAKKTPFAGILGSDDLTIELAAKAAEKLGLPHNPPNATHFTHRKDLARNFLFKAGANIPWHRQIQLTENIAELDLPFPVVIKPLNLSGSRGVIRANNLNELEQAIERISPIIKDTYDQHAKENILIEKYIHGKEIALEGLLHNNKLTTLAVFDKPDPLEGPYFEETYYITPSRLPSDTLLSCQQQVLNCCQAMGLRTGPVHAELRIDENNKPWILEVAARTIGGDCSQSLKPSASYSLEELVISYAIGEPIKPEPQQHSSGVLMIPVPKAGILKRVEGILDAQKVKNITSVSIDIPVGNEVQCLPESSSYLGFIFAEANSPEAVEKSLRLAHSKLCFTIQPVWSISAV